MSVQLPFSARFVPVRSLLRGAALVTAAFLSPLARVATAQVAAASAPSAACLAAKTSGAVALRAPAAKSALSLCDGYALRSGGAQGTPLALASADMDGDGVPDLVSTFKTGAGGSITIHRGNVGALWPYGAALLNGTPEAFLPNPRSFTVPESPDFVVTGDFDADGHTDIVIAQRGSSALYFLKGTGHGSFAAARRVEVKGAVTDLIAGEMNRPDGLTDLVVGIAGNGSYAALVYQSPLGAIKGSPETFVLSQPATALALGKFTGSTMRDLAIGAGNELTVVHGRDRMLSSGSADSVAPAVVTRQMLAFSVLSLATGDFTGRGPSIAALGNDGSVHILEHSVSAAALAETYGDSSAPPSMQVAGGKEGATGASETTVAQSKIEALRRMASSAALNGAEWTERSAVALPNGASVSAHGLVAARMSGSRQEDLLVVDRANSQVHVLSTTVKGQSKLASPLVSATAVPQMKVLSSLVADSVPAAVLPMRLNQHGLNGLVTLQAGASGPVVTPQDVPPVATFIVTNTSDITDTSQKNSPPDGSLRKAMQDAQNAVADNGGGTASIVFNIPTSDPGYNSATGTWKIQPISENVPGSLDYFALPPINYPITIDGYTQPGASPNTSTTSDNAKILIQIDGAKATTPGGDGFIPYFDTGTVIRGFAMTGWTTPSISSAGTASGGMGIEANGVGDFIEGNFIGTLDGKTAAANRIGIFVDNGPGSGNPGGTVVGGTTPQARNIISGNNVFGIAFLSIAYESALQGNFVGLDITGTAGLANSQDGVGMNGPTVTIGGTIPGARNYIAFNGTNVDINDLTNGGAATGSNVQGNYIGTDVTGTKALTPNANGVIIIHNPRNYLIGGTTPAARNIISGNLNGVVLQDNVMNNVVQGNYIGTDATGTIAVPNVKLGIFSGLSTSPGTLQAPSNTSIGGAVVGAGNVISGNGSDGVQISGSYSSSPGYTPYVGSTVQGNYIGTDLTGTQALPNQGNGVSFLLGATNNSVGGANGGVGNVIANNAKNGVLIDPGTTGGPGVSNTTIANIIFSNGGAGVRVNTGTANRISANSIYSNASLGIDIDATGPSTNSHCNVTNTGANLLQNYPVLTAGTGTTYISATATDASGNTSEFSKAVPATQTANLLSLLGTFDGKASSTFTIEFFSSPSADASGYGQGKTYIGSTTVTTDANCAGTITKPVDVTQADVSVTLTKPNSFQLGPDMGLTSYSAVVTNNGPATAHSVVLTDMLPAQLQVSSTYCNVGACQSPVTASQGTCTVSGKTITCALGAMAPGGVATIAIPVQVLVAGSITNTVNVTATEVDPNLTNNTAGATATAGYPYAFADHTDPAAVLINSPDLPMNVYGTGLTADTVVTFNNTTTLKVLGVVDNQVCGGAFSTSFCTALQVVVPASLLTTAGSYTVDVTNPASYTSSVKFTVASACTYSVFSSLDTDLENSGTNLIADSVSVSTNVASCPWTATSTVPWVTILDNASANGTGTVDVAVAPNTTASTRSGSITVAGQTTSFTQDAGSSSICTIGLNPSTLTPGAAGGSGTIAATLSNSSCAPFVEVYPQNSTYTPGVQWITFTDKSNLLIASGPVDYTIAPNNGPARTGAIVVGGNTTTVTQAAPSCYFTLSTNSVIASAAGATGSVTVTPTPSTCSWTATSSNTSQVSVTSGASGTGNGTVNYTVAANAGGSITPTISIGNSAATSVFTINQASLNTCTFTVTPTPFSVTSNGASNFFTVKPSFSFCKWTAVSNNPDSLAITGPTSGTGQGNVYYSVAQNTGTAARTLTITAGCQTFTINQTGTNVTVTNNPVPVLTTLSPFSVTAGSGAFTLTVNGSGFVSGATLNFNGSARTTTYVSPTQLSVAILASDVATQGTATVTVTNPAPGGGLSNALPFTVTASSGTNPTPVLTSLQPSSAVAGSGAFTLTVNGTGFVNGAIVYFNSVARVTSYVSATQVTAAILASDVATVGTVPVTAANPVGTPLPSVKRLDTPIGSPSNALTFTITAAAATNPAPVLIALQPASVTAGAGAFTLTVNGTGFVSGAVVSFNGSARATTYVSATQVTAAILASDVATVGTAPVTAANPLTSPLPAVRRQATSLGASSNVLTFTITAAVVNNPVPVLTLLSPASVTAGSGAMTLTVNGTSFVSGATVNVNGIARTTTFVSATQATAALLAADVASAGTASVTVTNPTPGGGTSNALTLTVTAVVVNNPVPTIAALSPASVIAGSGAQTLTVNGTNFVSSSTVTVSGTSRVATYVSATQLTVALLAADVATTGTASVIVTNPTPGGGASNAVSLTITAPVPTFTVSSPTGAQTISAGGSAQYAISVAPVNGTYSSVVTLSASGLPSGYTASFSPATVTPGSGGGSSTLTVTAPAKTALLTRPGTGWPMLASIIPLFGLLLVRGRKHAMRLMLVLIGLSVVGGLTGCGGGFGYLTSNSYNVTVTGTSGTTVQTTAVKLTVNY